MSSPAAPNAPLPPRYSKSRRKSGGTAIVTYMTSRKVAKAKTAAGASGGVGIGVSVSGENGASFISLALDKQEKIPVPMLGKEFRVRRWTRGQAPVGSEAFLAAAAAAAAAPRSGGGGGGLGVGVGVGGGKGYALGMVLPAAWVHSTPGPTELLQIAHKTGLEKNRISRFGRRSVGTKRTRGSTGVDDSRLDMLSKAQREQRKAARLIERERIRAAIIAAGGIPDDAPDDDFEEEEEAALQMAMSVADTQSEMLRAAAKQRRAEKDRARDPHRHGRARSKAKAASLALVTPGIGDGAGAGAGEGSGAGGDAGGEGSGVVILDGERSAASSPVGDGGEGGGGGDEGDDGGEDSE